MAVGVTPPVVLSVAGTDSSGGAGIAADLTTFAALGAYGTVAVTAVTAQNTTGVQQVYPLPAEFVAQQLDSVLNDLPVAAVKTGMLADPKIIAIVGNYAAAGKLPNLVIDPVMVSSTGDSLLDHGAENLYLELLEHSTTTTPNRWEAQMLCNAGGLHSFEALGELCGGCLVITGESTGIDRVFHNKNKTLLQGQEIDTSNDHGTGCTFSAAIASNLAHRVEPLEAIIKAKEFVRERIMDSANWNIGNGRGPVSHVLA
ncbi:MAG: bifunctional hydroxymethylpyrimidine kinase/phosphomethylpyrimidine kinase [Acidimicrobiia bacterium]|nr:bifunctional hydroxymethylpyrimidine kinase/phosphomethylpyrimidine kinase [Acidimicrobiia bacterium]MYC57768.1 bifunctional hydroxymethylpyrimidine kinase/phosphomethylpyrimidine kinase [Acidimicrobiia bacterium]MYG93451.1 bifunctional hydroxymethylpyrimidine kinase/phosphomethylpyrimidine kinase [Acidimicrobiia bacterium]MYI31317.1 bifunctional hydroxymethylpyrimidine kinase/phosphomethylpyrimidine kinase [Acidimicrobiia bacterium]